MPSNVRYMNQSAPFWDFIASLENQGNQGANHPFANQNREGRDSSDEENNNPWGWGSGWGWGHPRASRAWQHRGPPPPFGAPPPGPSHGPPEPPHPSHPPHPPHPPHAPEHAGPPGEHDGPQQPPHEGPGHDRRRGSHGPGPHRHGHPGGRRGFGGRRGWGGPGGPGGPFNMGNLSEFIQSQMFGQNQNQNENENEKEERSEDFKPDADVFDTESAFVVHVSLPGAKKEDIAVNWDVEKSELSIAGVTYRPGDEDFLKTLAMDERKVGAFERKVRLGSRANPAQIDADAISANFEDGVLQVTVPKQDKDYVEVKKVDIE